MQNAICSLGHHLPPGLSFWPWRNSRQHVHFSFVYYLGLVLSPNIDTVPPSQRRALWSCPGLGSVAPYRLPSTPAGSQPARLSRETAPSGSMRTIFTELFKEDVSLGTDQPAPSVSAAQSRPWHRVTRERSVSCWPQPAPSPQYLVSY